MLRGMNGVLLQCSSLISLLLQIILAFGNYMNSSKKGAAYGFRLQSLDLVSEFVDCSFKAYVFMQDLSVMYAL